MGFSDTTVETVRDVQMTRLQFLSSFIAGLTLSMLACACGPASQKVTPLTLVSLQDDVRLARERENRFNEVYKNPDAHSASERNLAVWNLPPLPVPKECMAPGSEIHLACMRYAARLHAIPFFISKSLITTGIGVVSITNTSPEGY